MLITFLSDFGLQDDFVGVCHAVVKGIAPDAHVIDLTHGIPPQRVLQGALVLASALRYVPPGIHLAVVDPGVGSQRRALALRGGGRLYVGPDNGLLLPAAERLGGIEAAHAIENRAYALEPVSATFHARDVFAPAAAHLARGVPLEELGPALDPASLVRLELPRPEVHGSRIHAAVLYADRFGNVQLNLVREHLEQLGLEPGAQVELDLGIERYFATVARTFADARRGDLILYEDAYGNVAVAINGGSAAQMLAVRPGQDVRITVAT